MNDYRKLSTKEKALKINLRKDVYGSFAEIGAGQEVAANFFKAGGASGTVAKTMSAYDMTFSDAIYGVCERYVCEPRLLKMLEHEYELLLERLPHRAADTLFFSFANTVESLNYKKTNQPHGWIGLRFQCSPNNPYNELILHIRMHDNDALLQQQALGTIGVNMLFACFFIKDPEEMLQSLMDGLDTERVEIDMFRIDGPDYDHLDNRLMALKLVKNGFTHAAMFGADGKVMQPAEALYKKNALVLRGRFRPVTHVNVDMLLTGRRHFKREQDVDKDKIVVFTELTLNDLRAEGEIDEKDFLNRVDIICSLGQNVMISNYQEYYRLIDYLSAINRGRKIGLIIGIYSLQRIFDEQYYTSLRGGLLESFGVLFGNNVKIFVYPSLAQNASDSNDLYTLDNFELPDEQKGLFKYLIDNDKLENIKGANTKLLHIISDDVLNMIQRGEKGWVEYVPYKVSTAIKNKMLFDYPGEFVPNEKKKIES